MPKTVPQPSFKSHLPATLKRGDHVEIADAVLIALRKISGEKAIFDEGRLYRFDKKYRTWAPITSDDLARMVHAFAGIPVDLDRFRPKRIFASDCKGVAEVIKDKATSLGFFADAPRGCAFTNGFVEVTERGVKLVPLTADHRVRVTRPFDFDPKAKPQRFLKFLDDIFRDDADKSDKIKLVREFFGSCVVGCVTQFQQCLVGVGSGENGKSKLADIVQGCMPEGSVCSIPPQLFGSEKYQRAELQGKLLNVVGELPDAEIVSSGEFKAIVGGDLINARKIRESPFDFRPGAGHFFACNTLPSTNDVSHGFWRRFVILTFNRNFEKDNARNPRIAEEILGAEMPQIVSWLLQGAAYALKNKRLIELVSHEEALKDWKHIGNQVSLWVEECAIPVTLTVAGGGEAKAAGWTRAIRLYRNYDEWREANGHGRLASNKFGSRLRELGFRPRKLEDGWWYPLRLKGGPAKVAVGLKMGPSVEKR